MDYIELMAGAEAGAGRADQGPGGGEGGPQRGQEPQPGGGARPARQGRAKSINRGHK